MDPITRARLSLNKGIRFNINCGLVPPNSPLPQDENGETNCINLILWIFDINPNYLPYPRIDWIYNNYPRLESPAVGSLICFPSRQVLGSEPGCIALVTEVNGSNIGRIILAHPDLKGIGEITYKEMIELRAFSNKPNRFVTVP